MSDTLGFVVVEWWGDRPELFDLDMARTVAASRRARTPGVRYTVHAVMAEEIEEGT